MAIQWISPNGEIINESASGDLEWISPTGVVVNESSASEPSPQGHTFAYIIS